MTEPKKEAETRAVGTGFPRGTNSADHLRRLAPNRPDKGKVIHAVGMDLPRGINSAAHLRRRLARLAAWERSLARGTGAKGFAVSG